MNTEESNKKKVGSKEHKAMTTGEWKLLVGLFGTLLVKTI